MKDSKKTRILMYWVIRRQKYLYRQLVKDKNINGGFVKDKNTNVHG